MKNNVTRLTGSSGGSTGDNRPSGKTSGPPAFNAPGIVLWTIGFLIFSFFALWVLPGASVKKFEFVAAVMPLRFLAGPEQSGGVLGMLAPLFTHMMLHANLMHIFFNSVWLLAFGAPVARRLGAGVIGGSILPASLFVTFFALSGAVGALLYVALNMKSTVLLVGASGGVFGLLGGLIRIVFSQPSHFAREPGKLAPITHRNVLIWSAVIIAANFLMTFSGLGLTPGANSQIAWEAHLGGYLFGLLSFPLFDSIARRR